MKVWHVDDVMTTDVAVVDRQTSCRDVVDVVMTRQVNAVPVIDGFHRVVGVVSEADLLHKVEMAGGTHEPRFSRAAGADREAEGRLPDG